MENAVGRPLSDPVVVCRDHRRRHRRVEMSGRQKLRRQQDLPGLLHRRHRERGKLDSVGIVKLLSSQSLVSTVIMTVRIPLGRVFCSSTFLTFHSFPP